MHQDHNIPWNTLARNLKFIEDTPHLTPHVTDLFPANRPQQGKELNYFVAAFVKTVDSFAETERTKYPVKFPVPSGGWDASKQALARHLSTVPTVATQQSTARAHVARLIERISPDPENAEEIIALVEANEMEPLLALAQAHSTSMIQAHKENPGRGYVHCGWLQLARYALRAYILINVVDTMPYVRDHGKYKKLESLETLLRDLNYDSMNWEWPHRTMLMEFQRPALRYEKPVAKEFFEDREKLHGYLSGCFRTLYRYRMLAKECGLGDSWEWLVYDTIYFMWKPKRDDSPNGKFV